MIIRRMWKGGPLRGWTDKATPNTPLRYQHGATVGYVGSYVCDRCKAGTVGVYRVAVPLRWLCAGCRERLPLKGKRKCK